MSIQGEEMGREDATRPWRTIIDECLAKALGNSFRQQIVWLLNERIASPSEIAKELRVSLNKVCHHIKVLEAAKCIELVFERPHGTSIQHFYQATSRAFLDDTDWSGVAESLKDGLRATLLRTLVDDAVDAVVTGTYDSQEGSHMSFAPMIVDDQGREELAQTLERTLLDVIAIQEVTKQRLISNRATGVSYTVSILGYPSVKGKKKVGPPVDAKELAGSTRLPETKAKKTTGSAGRAGKATPKAKRKKAKGKKSGK